MLQNFEKDVILGDLFFNVENKIGGRFINIGLENVAVAAASVVERPPRCSNKGGQKRR